MSLYELHKLYNTLLQREERALDVALDAILQRVVDIKSSLQELVTKIERVGDQADWPSYLNSFSVISAQVSILSWCTPKGVVVLDTIQSRLLSGMWLPLTLLKRVSYFLIITQFNQETISLRPVYFQNVLHCFRI